MTNPKPDDGGEMKRAQSQPCAEGTNSLPDTEAEPSEAGRDFAMRPSPEAVEKIERLEQAGAIAAHNLRNEIVGGSDRGCCRSRMDEAHTAACVSYEETLSGPDWLPPRRIRLDRLTPAERAIRAAVDEVERAGADVRLTAAVGLLQAAGERVADFVEGLPADHSADAGATTRHTLSEQAELSRLQHSLSLAVEALGPFDAFAAWMARSALGKDCPDDRVLLCLAPGCPPIKMTDFRRAATAYSKLTGGG